MPPKAGAGLVQFLIRDLMPVPQDLEQGVQSDQGPYLPSIGDTEIEGKYMKTELKFPTVAILSVTLMYFIY